MTANDVLKLHNDVIDSWNRHDTKKFLTYVEETVSWFDISYPQPVRGKRGAEDFFETWKTAFPDLRINTRNTVISGDKIAAEIEFSGTNTGVLKIGDQPEIPPTHRKVTNRGCYFGKIKNGKFVEVCTYPDLAGMMMQLGILEVHEAHA